MDIEKKINDILSKLTTDQKTALLHGCSGMEFGDLPEAGVPKVACADGPQGIRLEDGPHTTALPCGMALAATWNPMTAEHFGGVIAEEALSNRIQVSLGPGINLMRTPLNGRNFEYYGEDPVLAGRIASGYVRGCQAKGVAACPKHLALNNQEICRTTGNSICDKKTLRELYLEAFEIVIRESHPWMIMSSYNQINGEYASQCRYTQQEFCKDECGFDGVMVSDWGGVHAAKEAVRGGLDLEMGGHSHNWLGVPLQNQLGTNQIHPEELDDHVRRVLRLILRVTANCKKAPRRCGTAAHGKLSRAIGCESTVLLKNDGILPLNTSKLKRILICGPAANFRHCTDIVHGGGSGAVHPKHEVTALEAITARAGKGCRVDYAPGVLFHDSQLFPDEMLTSCRCEFYDTEAAMKSGKRPFLKESYHTLQLHWGIALAAGFQPSNEKLNRRPFYLHLKAVFTAKKSETMHIGFLLSRINGVTVTINGRQFMDAQHTALLDNSAPLKVQAGKSYTIELTGFHASQIEGCGCQVLLKSDTKQLCRDALALAKEADAVIYVGGSNHHYDREGLGWGDVQDADIPDLELPDGQSAFLTALSKANSKVIVALMGGSVMNIEPWIDSVSAFVDLWYPGQECGHVLWDILTGAASPEGHLPFTWGRRLQDYACHANGCYPGVREGYDPHVTYDEGIFIGYRHFDRAGIDPRFPFGFGLSYTTFDYRLTGKPKVTGRLADKSLMITVKGTIRNTGKRSGQALVQLYIRQPQCASEQRPLKILRDFTKIAIEPGECRDFTLMLRWRDVAFFNPTVEQFVAEAGTCRLLLADGQSRIWKDIPVVIR